METPYVYKGVVLETPTPTPADDDGGEPPSPSEA